MIVAVGIGVAGCGSGSVGGPSAGGGATGGRDAVGGDATGGGNGVPGADSSVGNGGNPTGAGGAAGTGGRAATGAGGVSGGSGGVSGATGGGSGSLQDSGMRPADAGMTAGCNAAAWPAGGTANPQTINVTVNGTTTARQFYFALPTNYASNKAYRLIFAWHYAGGMAATIAGNGGGGRYYGIQPLLPDSFFVAGQGLADAQGDAQPTTGWPNTNGRDVAFARAMVEWMNTNFCIDTSRVMSTGFSYGAIMSHTVACQMPDIFRAIGVMSGSLIGRANTCVNHNIAAWMTHGTVDDMVAFTSGESARDRLVTLNHCAATTQPATPSPCVSYDGCDSGYPVVWCPVQDEGHVIPSFGASAIANFFSQF
jgi:polyhydroxybutyrate depolymerase